MWVGLELNIMCFLGLMREGFSRRVYSWGWGLDRQFCSPVEASSMVKYFLAQSVGTGLFLIFPLMGRQPGEVFYFLSWAFLFRGLMLKGGVAPFHQWFPSVCAEVRWGLNLILIT